MPNALDYSEVLRTVPDVVFVVDADGHIVYVNHVLPGFSEADVIGSSSVDYVHPDHRTDYLERLARVIATGETEVYDIRSEAPHHEGYNWFHVRMRRLPNGTGRPHVVICSTDVTERKRLETQREALLADLQHALAQIDALQGLLPICAHCKRIRKADGAWEQIERVVERAAGAEFSHAICPSCVSQHYPDL